MSHGLLGSDSGSPEVRGEEAWLGCWLGEREQRLTAAAAIRPCACPRVGDSEVLSGRAWPGPHGAFGPSVASSSLAARVAAGREALS